MKILAKSNPISRLPWGGRAHSLQVSVMVPPSGHGSWTMDQGLALLLSPMRLYIESS